MTSGVRVVPIFVVVKTGVVGTGGSVVAIPVVVKGFVVVASVLNIAVVGAAVVGWVVLGAVVGASVVGSPAKYKEKNKLLTFMVYHLQRENDTTVCGDMAWKLKYS